MVPVRVADFELHPSQHFVLVAAVTRDFAAVFVAAIDGQVRIATLSQVEKVKRKETAQTEFSRPVSTAQ